MVFATSSRSCTERHGDFSESVVFHSSYEVSCWFLGSLLWLFCWFLFFVCFWLGDTLVCVSLKFSDVGMDNLNK